MEIGLDPKNSVVKRLWCIIKQRLDQPPECLVMVCSSLKNLNLYTIQKAGSSEIS